MLTIFAKRSIIDVWQGSEYALGSEHAKILDIPGFWICLGGSEHSRVLNISVLHRPLNMSEGAWIFPWYAWLCLNVPEYGVICVKYLIVPEWHLFYMSPFSFFVYLNAVIFFNKVYSLRNMRLRNMLPLRPDRAEG